MTEKKECRQRIFQHLDGIVTAPVAFILYKKEICSYLIERKEVQLAELVTKFQANEGYLNVALRTLASQGFLNYQVDNNTNNITINTNEKTSYAFSLFPLYEDVVTLLKETQIFTSVRIATNAITKLEAIFIKYKEHFNI